jgi:hypothetical protein
MTSNVQAGCGDPVKDFARWTWRDSTSYMFAVASPSAVADNVDGDVEEEYQKRWTSLNQSSVPFEKAW